MARLTLAQRQEIGAFANKPCSIASLARRYKVTPPVIRRWLEEGAKQHPNYRDKGGRGAKPKVSGPQASVIKRWAKSGCSTRKIARRQPHHGQPHLSKSTVHRVLTSGCHPLSWRVVRRTVKLREYNMRKRVEFCKAYGRAHVGRWVFVDGKYLYLYKSEGGYFHRKWQDLNYKPEDASRNPWVFRFYAAVAEGHKTPQLYFMPPSPPPGTSMHKSKDSYKSVHFQAFIDWLKVQLKVWYPEGTRQPQLILDHARQHTSAASRAYMQQEQVRLVVDYPPQSYDMNIIENIWAQLDNNLIGAKATSSDGWRKAIQRAWDKVPQSLIDKRVHSVKKRLARILEKDGDWLNAHDMKCL